MSESGNDPSNAPKPRFSPLTARTKAMGSSGWETYTVGFTLVGCIVAGAGAGWWLDSRLGTSYWLPILFFVGVVGGFREMFLVIRRVSNEQDRKKREVEAATVIHTPSPQGDESARPRERIFSVPPPPLGGEAPKEEHLEPVREVPETTGALMARLLEQDQEKSSSNAKGDERTE